MNFDISIVSSLFKTPVRAQQHYLWLFLALLNRIPIHRGYAIPNFCIIHLRHRRCRRHKLFVQMLSPLKFLD